MFGTSKPTSVYSSCHITPNTYPATVPTTNPSAYQVCKIAQKPRRLDFASFYRAFPSLVAVGVPQPVRQNSAHSSINGLLGLRRSPRA